MSALRLLFPLLLLTAACDRGSSSTTPTPASSATATGALAVTVDASGFHPASLTAKPNAPVHVTFTRTSDEGCGHQIVFPTLDLRRDLPLNQAVAVDFTMPVSGSLAFTCGMGMLRGSIVAQ